MLLALLSRDIGSVSTSKLAIPCFFFVCLSLPTTEALSAYLEKRRTGLSLRRFNSVCTGTSKPSTTVHDEWLALWHSSCVPVALSSMLYSKTNDIALQTGPTIRRNRIFEFARDQCFDPAFSGAPESKKRRYMPRKAATYISPTGDVLHNRWVVKVLISRHSI